MRRLLLCLLALALLGLAPAAAQRRPPVGPDALRRRPVGPLPARRPVAVPPRPGRHRHQGRASGVDGHGRLEPDDGPERLERRGRLAGVDGGRRSAGTARTSSCPTRIAALAVGGPLRVRQLPRDGVAERARDRRARRRLPPVRAHPLRARADAARTGSSCASTRAASRPTSRPPATTSTGIPSGGWWNYSGILREVYLRRVDTADFDQVLVRPTLRCATLRREGRDDAPRCATRPARGRPITLTGHFGVADRRARHAARRGRAATATLHRRASRSATRGCGRRRSPALYAVSFVAARGRPAGRDVRAPQRHPLDQGRRRAAVHQRPAGELPRRRLPRGQQGAGLRDRQRRARQAGGGDEGARRDDDAHALPAASLPARARRPRGDPAVVGGPGLLGQQRAPAPIRALRGAAVELVKQNIEANRNHPSVLAWSIANELDSRAGRRRRPTTSTAPTAVAKELDPTRPDRDGPRSATSPPAARPPTRRSTSSASTSTSAGTRARAARSSTHELLSGYLDSMRALLPGQGDRGHGVRRRGQPRRPGRGEGHLGRPGGVRQLPPRRLRDQAVAQRRDLLGAQRVPRPPGLGGRQPAPAAADPPEGAARLRHVAAQAGVGRRAALVRAARASTGAGDAARRAACRAATRRAGCRAGAGMGGWAGRRAGRGRRVAQLPGAAQPARGLLGVGQRDAARRARLGLRPEPVVAASAAAVVVVRRAPGRRSCPSAGTSRRAARRAPGPRGAARRRSPSAPRRATWAESTRRRPSRDGLR